MKNRRNLIIGFAALILVVTILKGGSIRNFFRSKFSYYKSSLYLRSELKDESEKIKKGFRFHPQNYSIGADISENELPADLKLLITYLRAPDSLKTVNFKNGEKGFTWSSSESLTPCGADTLSQNLNQPQSLVWRKVSQIHTSHLIHTEFISKKFGAVWDETQEGADCKKILLLFPRSQKGQAFL